MGEETGGGLSRVIFRLNVEPGCTLPPEIPPECQKGLFKTVCTPEQERMLVSWEEGGRGNGCDQERAGLAVGGGWFSPCAPKAQEVEAPGASTVRWARQMSLREAVAPVSAGERGPGTEPGLGDPRQSPVDPESWTPCIGSAGPAAQTLPPGPRYEPQREGADHRPVGKALERQRWGKSGKEEQWVSEETMQGA